jgi:hypothetical protein
VESPFRGLSALSEPHPGRDSHLHSTPERVEGQWGTKPQADNSQPWAHHGACLLAWESGPGRFKVPMPWGGTDYQTCLPETEATCPPSGDGQPYTGQSRGDGLPHADCYVRHLGALNPGVLGGPAHNLDGSLTFPRLQIMQELSANPPHPHPRSQAGKDADLELFCKEEETSIHHRFRGFPRATSQRPVVPLPRK